jgi:hypothetical protein
MRQTSWIAIHKKISLTQIHSYWHEQLKNDVQLYNGVKTWSKSLLLTTVFGCVFVCIPFHHEHLWDKYNVRMQSYTISHLTYLLCSEDLYRIILIRKWQ